MENRKAIKANKLRLIIFSISGFLTLVPYGLASKINLIGYKSLCTLTPISSIICFGWAVLFLLKYMKSIKAVNN